jgi:UDP-N-acetyl-D-mannosaminuronate dehydrogenase
MIWSDSLIAYSFLKLKTINFYHIEISKKDLQKYDLVIVSIDHIDFDNDFIAENSLLIIDTPILLKKME